MRIILFRHGIAIDRDDPASPDEEDRFLTDRGIKRTRAAVAGLVRMGIEPERILSSPWLRARQTAEIAAEAYAFHPDCIEVTEAFLPSALPARFLEPLVVPGAGDVLAVGHLPHLDSVLRVLTRSNAAPLKKAGAACIELSSTRAGSGRLEWMMPPRVLREIGRR